jgi:putative NADH-flavin reductase
LQITVFGAAGHVGQQVVTKALAEGHTVQVFVHRHNPFGDATGVTMIQGDIVDAAAVKKALQGSEAAISALGSWHTKSKDIVQTGMQTIIPAMQELGIKRLITVTGAGALWEHDTPGAVDKLNHTLLGIGAGKILADGEAHLRLLEASGLDWTCLRSPIMTNKDSTRYRLTLKLPMPWASIPRHAVSQCLVDQLESKKWQRQAPVIRRG